MHSLQAGLHPDILPELQNKGILSSSAYDVAIDYILLDAFDDLTDPPRAVLAVLHGMPFGRQPLLENAVWGIIQAKSKLNFGPFKARYYALMKQVSPYLASGLLECAVPYGDPRHRSGPGRFWVWGGFPRACLCPLPRPSRATTLWDGECLCLQDTGRCLHPDAMPRFARSGNSQSRVSCSRS